MSRGVIYIATAEKYVRRAVRSAESLKQSNPTVSVALVTDTENIDSDLTAAFDRVVSAAESFNDMRVKSFNMLESPYEKTLYVDVDVHFCGDITPVFDLLDRFEFAAAHAPIREANRSESIPESFPDFNAGVLAFRNTSTVTEAFSRWQELYQSQIDADTVSDPMNDQTPLRQALWNSDVSLSTLPPEYNCRFVLPGYIGDDVKIIHGHLPESMELDLQSFAEVFNKHDGPRLYTGYPDQRLLYTTPMLKSESYPQRFAYLKTVLLNSIESRGVLGTIRRVIDLRR
jgi:hypothetical protein